LASFYNVYNFLKTTEVDDLYQNNFVALAPINSIRNKNITPLSSFESPLSVKG